MMASDFGAANRICSWNGTGKMRSKASWAAGSLAVMVVASHTPSVQAGQEPPSGQSDVTPVTAAQERVDHFAVVCCGWSRGSERHKKWYWQSNERIGKMLKEVYGYPDESVYRLCEEGKGRGPAVDGRSSLVNFRAVFEHLAKIMEKDDHLFVYLVGHGEAGPRGFVFEMTDGQLTGIELSRLLDAVPTERIVVVANPCNSGALIPAISKPGRVICTSTTAREGNAAGWEGSMTNALAGKEDVDADGDGRISIKEAYNASIDGTVEWYRKKGLPLQEHPLLDDNGDGVGHHGKDPLIEADGTLAANTFLGNNGKKLQYSRAALQRLANENQSLELE
jgi:hypothetical protein